MGMRIISLQRPDIAGSAGVSVGKFERCVCRTRSTRRQRLHRIHPPTLAKGITGGIIIADQNS